jgi:hypothetical protein
MVAAGSDGAHRLNQQMLVMQNSAKVGQQVMAALSLDYPEVETVFQARDMPTKLLVFVARFLASACAFGDVNRGLPPRGGSAGDPASMTPSRAGTIPTSSSWL